MIASFIALLGISLGIIGANITGFVFKKYSFGFTGNTIIGVFGSIILIKIFGQLGIDPKAIMQSGAVNYLYLIIIFFISFFGGVIAIYFGFKLKTLINKDSG